MIEFNIPANTKELKELLDVIKAQDIKDVRVNVVPEILVDVISLTSAVPVMRLRHIAKIMKIMIDKEKKGLSKQELIGLLVADGLAASTASVYISGASGAGIIEKTEHGYCLTAKGQAIL